MNWLRDNPVGMVLAGISGFLLLLMLAMSVLWTLPVRVDDAASQEAVVKARAGEAGKRVKAHDLKALRAYSVINEKPVFDESRQPELVDADSPESSADDQSIAVRDAPKVKLTGVIITPALRMASLTPVKAGEKSVSAHEGESLTGEYVGWQLAVVKPRAVVLASADGRSLQLELEVHDAKIKEPPKPTPANDSPPQNGGQTQAQAADGEEPLSRAEQIRQRIAERREELRRQQEEKRAQEAKGSSGGSSGGTNAYQDAVRAMMRNNSRNKGSDDNEEG